MSRLLRYLVYAFLAALVVWAFPGHGPTGSQNGEWRSYAGDAGQHPLFAADQITRDNVKNLQVAWSWRFDNFGGGTSETTPHHGERRPLLHRRPAPERDRRQSRHRRNAVDVAAG